MGSTPQKVVCGEKVPSPETSQRRRLAGAVLRRSVRSFERVPPSFQFKGQTEKRKQRAAEQQAASRHQKRISIIIERRKMPEEIMPRRS